MFTEQQVVEARTSPLGYGMAIGKGKIFAVPHLVLLNEALVNATFGPRKRLMVFMPPRHAKSTTISRFGAGWFLGTFPEKRVCVASYEADFASSWGRAVRQDIVEYGDELFGLRVSGDSAAVDRWSLAGHDGGMRCAGIGGGLTGIGLDYVSIDDPIKDAKQAHSKSYRDGCFDWMRSVVETRLEPDAVVVMVMCMVGSTPVLMADGTEKPLRDVRSGDAIATYDRGRVAVSTVKNWKSQGHDDVYEIRTRGGRIVRANERHPFLVESDGSVRWVRLRDLKAGDAIVAVTRREARCEGSCASSLDADGQRPASADARSITTPLAQPMGSSRLPSTRAPALRNGESIGTGSLRASTTRSARSKEESARSVSSLRRATFARIGGGNFASTTTTKPARCAGYSATTAISPSGTARRQRRCCEPLDTFGIAPDPIVSVTPVGREEVFDIEVAGTENFIANGLVSHNTRWHEDDLAGRTLKEHGDEWDVLSLPALAEGDHDPLGRAPGEALWPKRFPKWALEMQKRRSGSYWFNAQYQQHPSPEAGNKIRRDWFKFYGQPPKRFDRIITSTDCSFKDTEDSSFVVMQAWGTVGADAYLLDQIRARMDFPETQAAFRQFHRKWAAAGSKLVEDKANGPAIIASLKRLIGGILPIEVSGKGSKVARLSVVTPYFESGNIFVPDPAVYGWVSDYIEELVGFPNAANDDQVDATSQALSFLFGGSVISLDGGPEPKRRGSKKGDDDEGPGFGSQTSLDRVPLWR